jgi:uncharacterized protein (TIGR02722 family)
MRKSIFLFAGLFMVTLLSGCATTSVKRVDADTEIDLSGYWNDTDVRKVCQTLIADCLDSPAVARRTEEWRRSHKNENPTVILGTIANKSSEHMDTGIIGRMMQTAIINSGELDFVADAGFRDQLRAEREDQQYNASEASAAAMINEASATFMLEGDVRSIVEKSGNESVRSYFVNARLTNIETNRIIWQGENTDVKKYIRQATRKL